MHSPKRIILTFKGEEIYVHVLYQASVAENLAGGVARGYRVP